MEYSIGYTQTKRLLELCHTEDERDAIRRLRDFRGSAFDLAVAGGIDERNGASKLAQDIRSTMPTPEAPLDPSREEWIARCSARLASGARMTPKQAYQSAVACYEDAAAGDIPEDAADEELFVSAESAA